MGPEGRMTMRYVKYHALGNDYIVIPQTGAGAGLDRRQVERLCHRNYGVGSDGLPVRREYVTLKQRSLLTSVTVLAAVAALTAAQAAEAPAEPERGAVVLKPDFESAAERGKWSASPGAKWVQDAPGGNWSSPTSASF
jgi:hypothetical protein